MPNEIKVSHFCFRNTLSYSFHCFRDFGAVLAENKIGWAVWGWGEGFRLSRRTVEGKPVVDTVVAEALGLKVG